MRDLKTMLRGNQKGVPILFVDLDGTVRKGLDELGRFVNNASDVEVFEGVPELLRRYKENGYRIVGVTNQGGVALGHLSVADMNGALVETVRQCGDVFDRIVSCVHHPDAKDPEMAVCWCRKPRIGMLVFAGLTLGQQYDEFYPPHLMLMVGDRPEDEQCAANAGIAFKWAADWRREMLT